MSDNVKEVGFGGKETEVETEIKQPEISTVDVFGEIISINDQLLHKIKNSSSKEINSMLASNGESSDKYYLYYAYLSEKQRVYVQDSIKTEIEAYKEYATKPATMIAVDRAATNVYSTLLKMIKVLNEEIEEIKLKTGVTTSADEEEVIEPTKH